MANAVETKPDFPLSIVEIRDELYDCQHELAAIKGTFILLENYFIREEQPLQETAVSQEEHYIALEELSRKGSETMSAIQDKIAKIGFSLEKHENKKEE